MNLAVLRHEFFVVFLHALVVDVVAFDFLQKLLKFLKLAVLSFLLFGDVLLGYEAVGFLRDGDVFAGFEIGFAADGFLGLHHFAAEFKVFRDLPL